MIFLPFSRMRERLEISKSDSDFNYFMHLLYYGELLTKLVILGLTSAIKDDPQKSRYSIIYKIVRADGLGDWVKCLNDIVKGPPSQFLNDASRLEQRTITERVIPGNWQYDSVRLLFDSMTTLNLKVDPLQKKQELTTWFYLFTQLRNKTRGHGATQPNKCGIICKDLEQSISLIANNFPIFDRQWAYLYQNLSGIYRVTRWSEKDDHFKDLKKHSHEPIPRLQNGVYIYFDSYTQVELVSSDPDANDIFLSNGNFTDKNYEVISYFTDSINKLDSSPYLSPSTELPDSETGGLSTVIVSGNCFNNIPILPSEYIPRSELEESLNSILLDDHHPLVTLVGRGGIGKTWLALSVLHKISRQSRFNTILWFSARDIDLFPEGPKKVKPRILDQKDISNEFLRLIETINVLKPDLSAIEFFTDNLKNSSIGPVLFVFDNFETVNRPAELFQWLDTYIRLPNKILITTRFREFKADYFIDVYGMTRDEVSELIEVTSKRLGIRGLITEDYEESIFIESNGHPYVINILLGEVAKAKSLKKIERIVADSDEILTALFERTYSGLSLPAKRVFLTLCQWRSMIPQIALEAVLLRPKNERIDVQSAINELLNSSFIEQIKSEKDNEYFISVPLVAFIFGRKKLEVDPMKNAIEADSKILQSFGASREVDINSGLLPRIERLMKFLAEKNILQSNEFEVYLPIIESVAMRYPITWINLASLYEESVLPDRLEKQKTALFRYLESTKDLDGKKEAWNTLGKIFAKLNDYEAEMHARIELSQLTNIPFSYISDSANRFNLLFGLHILNLDTDVKRIMIDKLLNVMEKRMDEGNVVDCSRIAWLFLHVNNQKKAIEYTRKGLRKNPFDDYIRSVAYRLNLI